MNLDLNKILEQVCNSATDIGVYLKNEQSKLNTSAIEMKGLRDYVSYVDYWMAFIGTSYGIHDASWRSEFGNPIYKGNGSHGCVNTPYSAVQTIYNNIPSGTPVIIY